MTLPDVISCRCLTRLIEHNGAVVVRPPKSLSPENVDAVVESKRLWIYRNLAEWRDLNATAVIRE